MTILQSRSEAHDPRRSNPGSAIRTLHRLEVRLAVLRVRLSDLEIELSEEQARPLPDDLIAKALKRRKLSIKDEMLQVEIKMRHAANPHSMPLPAK